MSVLSGPIFYNSRCLGMDGIPTALPGSSAAVCGGLTAARTEDDVKVDAGGGVTEVTETYDLQLTFADAGGQWAGYLVFSQPVTPDTVALKSQVKLVASWIKYIRHSM